MKTSINIILFSILTLVIFTSSTQMRGIIYYVKFKTNTIPPPFYECTIPVSMYEDASFGNEYWVLYNTRYAKFVGSEDLDGFTITEYIFTNFDDLICPPLKLSIE